ncbi:ribonuclease domain-containing protein [Paenibacillaceae bacterium WGS1546]|uniref:ribonuclease domain-containing protein n=1 Tax=Cohnella sp. WGS1546 TaxID=3366810 RepID=UPI00372D5753
MLSLFFRQTGRRSRLLAAMLAMLAILLAGCGDAGDGSSSAANQPPSAVAEAQKELQAPLTGFREVSDYIRTYGRLPDNYITKKEAEKLGWVPAEGNLDRVAPGRSIGGDRFRNREGLLPEAQGRIWHEADINYEKGPRGADRIVYSNDGLIFMTTDHYRSFIDITEEGSVPSE